MPAGAVLKLPPGVDVTTAAGVLLAYSQCHRLLQRGSMQLQWYLPLTTGDLSTVQACQWRLAHRTWRLRCARGSAQGRLCSCLAAAGGVGIAAVAGTPTVALLLRSCMLTPRPVAALGADAATCSVVMAVCMLSRQTHSWGLFTF